MPTLTVVIPVYNQAAQIGATLAALDRALGASSFEADVLVVDDGSTDGTAEAVEAAGGATVLRQENRGRFEARRAGLDAARGDYCLLLDSRVRLEPGGLAFVEEHLASGREIWNGHVDIDRDDGPYAVFWDVLTRRAFRTYFAEPRTTSFGLAEFERFPKGTTCLLAPRAMLVEAFDRFRSGYGDLRNANDDAPVLRSLAAEQPINISPGFRCTYSSRTALRPFLRHAFHRGTVFVDGHGRPESAWFPIVLGLYAASAGCALLACRSPRVVVAAAAAAGAGGAALSLAERRPRDAATMAWVTPLYAAAHVAGMWRGLALLMRARL
jgi:glycosyltransferase involved in cell wall biosynthesis